MSNNESQNELSDQQKEFFLQEINTISEYRKSFSAARLAILSGAIASIGFMVRVEEGDFKFPTILVEQFAILAIVWSAILMITSYTGAIYAFFVHIEKVEDKFKVDGFSKAYLRFIKVPENSGNSATEAFRRACNIVNLAGHGYIMFSGAYTLLSRQGPSWLAPVGCPEYGLYIMVAAYIILPLVSAATLYRRTNDMLDAKQLSERVQKAFRIPEN